MTDAPDAELLERFTRNQSEAAFAELVERHIGLVYSTALRKTDNSQHAEDITQAVFIILARKAGTLGPKTVLPGWLYHTARLTAANHQRAELRRIRREQEAFMQSAINEPAPDALWCELSPLLEDAMAGLGSSDRDAIVLRFFQNRSMADVGAAFGASEDAAKMRVNRALEKLRKFFNKRGVVSTTAIISGIISSNSVQAAPVALAKSVTAVAIAHGATAGTSTLTLVKGALKIMAWSKAQTTAVLIGIGVAGILAGGTAIAVEKGRKTNSQLIESYFTRLDTHYLDTAPPMVLLRPSKYADQDPNGAYMIYGLNQNGVWDGKILRRGAEFTEILRTAYGFGPEQMVLPPNMPQGKFDLLLTVTNDPATALQHEIKKQFGLVAHTETTNCPVLLLRCVNPDAPGIKVSQGRLPTSSWGPGNVRYTGYRMSGEPNECDLVHEIGMYAAGLPVIDETGLTNFYDINFHWDPNLTQDKLKSEFPQILMDQLGLQLVPSKRDMDILIVERAK